MGTVSRSGGRPEHVYCRWRPKGDDLVHEVFGSEDFRAGVAAFVEGSAPTWSAEYRFRRADGIWRVLDATGSRLPADSPVSGIVVNAHQKSA